MKNNKIRIASLMLALLFCLGVLSACNNEVEDTSSVASGEVSQDAVFPYADEFYDTTVTILCVETARHFYGELQFAPNDENKGNVINDAVAERNNRIEDLYGVKIELAPVKYPAEDIRAAVTTGLTDYDLVCESVDRMVSLVTENVFWSLDDVLDINQPWWDKNAIEGLAITDKHYFVSGDAILTDDDNTYLYLFNKKLYNENTEITEKYGDIYQVVRDGKFTIDLFTEMSKLASFPDENGQWGFNATYGNLSHAYGATVMMNGAGIAMAEMGDDGEFHINVGTEHAVEVFGDIYDLMSNKQITQRAELIIGQGKNPSTYGFAELGEMFSSGRGLFYQTTASSITGLKTSTEVRDFDFGVLPIPKYSETQDSYFCPVNRYHSSVLGIPTSNTGDQLKATAFLMQALGFYNEDVIEAYFEITLQLQAVTTDADAEMLELVYNNRIYDLGSMFGWGDNQFINLYGSVISDSTANTLVSKWQSIEPAVVADMEETIEQYRNSQT